MRQVFDTVLNMSVTGAFVILIVLAIRLFLKKAPKKFSYLLWAVVAIRLCCPISLSLPVSVIPEKLTSGAVVSGITEAAPTYEFTLPDSAAETAPITTHNEEQIPIAKQPATGEAVNARRENFGTESEIRRRATTAWLPAVWLSGASLMAIYAAASYILLHRKMRTAVRYEGNVWQSEHVRSPFILGYIRPRIYIPYALDTETERYVLEHERYHLKRGDHIINALAYILLCVHWFNPLCWLAFIFMGRDMEMSCDENVLDRCGAGKRAYSMSLLSFAANRRFPAPSPLAFGETGVKTRVKNTLNYKKPAFWIILAAVVVCLAAAVCLLTNPVGMKFDFTENRIESAKTQYADNDFVELNADQISELERRLADVKRLRRSDKYDGFTPAYSITANRTDGTFINVCGYRTDTPDMVDISNDGKRYVVKDGDFCAYLLNVCTGGDTEPATDITELLTAAVIDNLGSGWWKGGGLKTGGVYEAGAFEELGKREIEDATEYYGICLYRLYDADKNCIDEFQTDCAITVKDGMVTEFWMPGDGAYYEMDIAEKFPPDVADMLIDAIYEFYQKYHEPLAERCDADIRPRTEKSEKAWEPLISEIKGIISETERSDVLIGLFQNGERLGDYSLDSTWNGHLKLLTEDCNWRRLNILPETVRAHSSYIELYTLNGWSLKIYEESMVDWSDGDGDHVWASVRNEYTLVYNIVRGWFDEAEHAALLGGRDYIRFTVPDRGQSHEEVAQAWVEQYEGVRLHLSEGSHLKCTEISIINVCDLNLSETYDYYPEASEGKPRFGFSYDMVFTKAESYDNMALMAGNTREYRDENGEIVPGKYIWSKCGIMYLTDDGWRCDDVGTGL